MLSDPRVWGSLVAVIGGLLAAWAWYVARTQLKVRAKIWRQILPIEVGGQIEKMGLALRELARKKEFEERAASADVDVANLFPRHFFREYGPRALLFEGCWYFEIENRGRAELRDLVLEMPFEGYYQIGEEGDVRGLFKKRIELGQMRSLQRMEVFVWIPAYWDKDTDSMHVSHPGGTFPIRFAHDVYGTSGNLISEFYQKGMGKYLLLTICFSLISLVVSLGLSLFLADSHAKPSPTTSTPTTVHAK
ncbi:MAG: hypothetical protein H7144_17270 [Burkholderiales bacterium]|nr:hypothetical protein [Phycisphaerae bacterium]